MGLTSILDHGFCEVMKSLYHFLIPFLLIPTAALAADYEGIVTKYKSKLALLESKSQKKMTIIFKNIEIESQVRKLAPGDYISFEGVRSSIDQTIRIESLNFVGLKSIVGKWTGNDGFCYEFANFNEMYVFIQGKTKCDFAKRAELNARYLTYTINPTTSGWLALISDDTASYAGEILLKSPVTASLSLYDSDSGDILKTIILKK
ncbi:MAG: hypothetical protein H7328_03295 [Bdellovibrio sp.]|nr:hypothetical protein [Bdellovibrio sp.]